MEELVSIRRKSPPSIHSGVPTSPVTRETGIGVGGWGSKESETHGWMGTESWKKGGETKPQGGGQSTGVGEKETQGPETQRRGTGSWRFNDQEPWLYVKVLSPILYMRDILHKIGITSNPIRLLWGLHGIISLKVFACARGQKIKQFHK